MILSPMQPIVAQAPQLISGARSAVKYAGPSLALRFDADAYRVGPIGSQPAASTLAGLVTFTRASGGGRFNASGNYEYLGNDVPRLDYDPVTLQPRGILIEEQRTNLLLNSDTLATQTITVTAAAHTLTFYGTGSVALSGAFSGTLVGTGAANRVSLTFTPTAGSLTLTVTGSCTSGQLEAGAFPTSYIPTVASQVTRSADVASVNTLSPWYNASEGTLFVDGDSTWVGAGASYIASLDNGTTSNTIAVRRASTNLGGLVIDSAAVQANPQAAYTIGSRFKAAIAYKADDFAFTKDGAAPLLDSVGTIPAITKLNLGSLAGSLLHNGHIRNISYYPRAYSGIVLQEMT